MLILRIRDTLPDASEIHATAVLKDSALNSVEYLVIHRPLGLQGHRSRCVYSGDVGNS